MMILKLLIAVRFFLNVTNHQPMKMTAAEYQERFGKSETKSKFRNEVVEFDGEKFDSKKELARYGELLLLQKNGDIKDLKKQFVFKLEVENKLICKYIADFTYITSGGKFVVEDVKSKHTRKLPVYRIKKKLMAAIYGIEIKEV